MVQQRNYLNSTLIEEFGQFVWKDWPVNNVTRPDFSGFYIDYHGNKSKTSTPKNGEEVVFYNFTDQEMIGNSNKVTTDGPNSGQSQSMKFPTSFKISVGSGEFVLDTGRVGSSRCNINPGKDLGSNMNEKLMEVVGERDETGFTFTKVSNGDTLTSFKYRYK